MTTPPPRPVGDLELWLSSDEPDRAAICLCFSDSPAGASPPLDPSRATSLLGLTPTRAAARGRPLPSPLQHRPAEEEFWRWDGPTSSRPVAAQVADLLARLPPPGAAWDELRPYAGRLICAIYLEFWNRECDIPAALVEAVAARHLALHFDIYYPQAEPDAEDAEDADDTP